MFVTLYFYYCTLTTINYRPTCALDELRSCGKEGLVGNMLELKRVERCKETRKIKTGAAKRTVQKRKAKAVAKTKAGDTYIGYQANKQLKQTTKTL